MLRLSRVPNHPCAKNAVPTVLAIYSGPSLVKQFIDVLLSLKSLDIKQIRSPRRESNPQPPALEGFALPLSYGSLRRKFLLSLSIHY